MTGRGGFPDYAHMRSELLEQYLKQQSRILDAAARYLAAGDMEGASAMLRMDCDGLNAFLQIIEAQKNLMDTTLHVDTVHPEPPTGGAAETDIEQAVTNGGADSGGIRRYEPVLVPALLQTEAETYALPGSGRVLVLGQRNAALERALEARGLVCEALSIGLGAAELSAAFAAGDVAGVIGVQDAAWGEEAGAAFVHAMLFSAQGLSLTFGKERSKPFLAAVTRLGGRFGMGSVAPGYVCGSVAGLCKTLAKEWRSRAAVRCVDVAPDAPDALVCRILTNELRFGGETETGWPSGDERLIFSLQEKYETEPSQAKPGPEDVFLVSGGGRGISAICLETLAGRSRCAFALLARTGPRPEDPAFAGAESREELCRLILLRASDEGNKREYADAEAEAGRMLSRREMAETLRRLEAAGSRVRLYPCDIADADAVRRAAAAAERELGPVTGVIHAAGVIADKNIGNKTEDEYRRVFGTKYLGLRNLLSAVDAEGLKHILLFSSVAGYFGNPGQADYASANEYLDHFARYWKHTHPACNVQALCWGLWDAGMTTPSIKKLWKALGKAIITPKTGARYFIDAVEKRHAPGQCQAVYSDSADPWRRSDGGR